jgi:hypothetical protein
MKVQEEIKKETDGNELKLKSAIQLLQEKLSQAGVEFEGKSIIIKDSQLTIK